MKRTYYIISFAFTLLSCNQNNMDGGKVSQLTAEIENLKNENAELKKATELLKFSATDRYKQIISLIAENRLSDATKGINDLKSLFPISEEAKLCNKQELIITEKIAKLRAEDERLKALGFKIFNDNTSTKIGPLTASFSGFTYGRTYTFDYCNDVNEYSYHTADKDNTYLLSTLVLSTKEKHASVPNLGLYVLMDGILKETSSVMSEYASWTSYGAKIGNYSDNSHDFSKVNSVTYRLAAEISQEESSKPLFLIVKNDGGERGKELTVETVKKDYIVIKIMNKNKI